MQTPLVSISLVAFNQGAYIREAIESCLMQKVDFNYEIIIHDDASTDNSAEIILEYANEHPEIIRPIIQTENQFSKGTEVNAKIVIPKARGKYIAFLEADDYWIDPNKLQNQVNFLKNNPDVVMCFTATKRIFPNSSKDPKINRFQNRDTLCEIKDVIRHGGSLVDMGSAVVQRSIFNDVPDWYYYAQTWDLTVPLLSLLHGKIQYLNEVTSVYRYNVSGSWTQKNFTQLQRRKKNRIKSIRVTDGFDQESNYKYHEYVRKKLQPLIVEVLLLSSKEDDDFSHFYSRLSFISKIEYFIFNLIGSMKIWGVYRYFKKQIRDN